MRGEEKNHINSYISPTEIQTVNVKIHFIWQIVININIFRYLRTFRYVHKYIYYLAYTTSVCVCLCAVFCIYTLWVYTKHIFSRFPVTGFSVPLLLLLMCFSFFICFIPFIRLTSLHLQLPLNAIKLKYIYVYHMAFFLFGFIFSRQPENRSANCGTLFPLPFVTFRIRTSTHIHIFNTVIVHIPDMLLFAKV